VNSDEEMNWDNFLLEVATKRQEHGMTHKDLADNAGTVERTISRLLSEPTKNPSLFLVASICQTLHISLDKHFVKEVYNTDSQNSDEMIEVLKDQVRQRRKLSKTLFAVIFVLLAMMILYLVLIDANNLNYGLIRD
jgi:DNA-binding XRE family transcriptional regulator